MERSLQVLQHENPKIWLKKVQNWILTCIFDLSVYTTVIIDKSMERSIMSTTTWKPKNLIFFSKKFEIEFWRDYEELISP